MSKGKKIANIQKILVLGDAAVGKTSIIHRYQHGEFNEKVKSTIGLQPSTKTIEYNEDTIFKLQIWDTPGDEPALPLIKPYIFGVNVVLHVFAVDDRLSFEHVPRWFEMVNDAVISHRFLIGNKTDKDAVVAEEEIRTLARRYGMFYYPTSAKTGENIEEVFENILLILDRETLVEFVDDFEIESVEMLDGKKKKRCRGCFGK